MDRQPKVCNPAETEATEDAVATSTVAVVSSPASKELTCQDTTVVTVAVVVVLVEVVVVSSK